MALGIAEIIIFGLLVDWLVRKITIPGLIGMLVLGIICGPYVLDFFLPNLLTISHDLRLIALIVILLRAGFELSIKALAKVGRMALVLSVVPAIMEGVAITLLGPHLLGLTYMESAILGAILAAVSPAVVVPLMIHFIEQRKGVEKAIPTLLLAAASIDDVFVIVIYSVLIGMYTGSGENIVWQISGIPISIITGIAVGLILGLLIYKFFHKFNPRATKSVFIILGVSIFLIKIEHSLEGILPFAALLAVMSIGVIILEKREHFAHEISAKLGKIWVLAELVLFVMVGAQVNIQVAWHAGLMGALLIFLGLIARSIGTYICLLGSELDFKERMFVVISYIPKATVQAAIGAAPLAAMQAAGMSTKPGELILAIAVLSILLTAPLGAWAISFTGKRWLKEAPFCEDTALNAVNESR